VTVDSFDVFKVVAGPADGLILEFPDTFTPEVIEFWVKVKGGSSFFATYALDFGSSRYKYTGWSLESKGADWSDELHPQKYASLPALGDGKALWNQKQGWHSYVPLSETLGG
jgi:hypothetical protein